MAASYTLISSRFPNGTVVHVNPTRGSGDEPVSATMASGSATFDGLREFENYLAHATVNGQNVEVGFRTDGNSGTSVASVEGLLYDEDLASYPPRDPDAVMAIFQGPEAPLIGGSGAVEGVDMWVPTIEDT
jgi:hypothetical protein